MSFSRKPDKNRSIPKWEPKDVPVFVSAQDPIVRKPVTTAEELHEDVKRAIEEVANPAHVPTKSLQSESTYKKAVVSDQGPVPGYAEGKARELVVGERGVLSLEPDPLGLAISGTGGTVVIPLARIAWLKR